MVIVNFDGPVLSEILNEECYLSQRRALLNTLKQAFASDDEVRVNIYSDESREILREQYNVKKNRRFYEFA